MYASVTDIIPNMDDQSKISGRILHLNLYSFLFPYCDFFTLTLINYRYCGQK